jgi:hypothetical protein
LAKFGRRRLIIFGSPELIKIPSLRIFDYPGFLFLDSVPTADHFQLLGSLISVSVWSSECPRQSA